jgi:hypothetical protein
MENKVYIELGAAINSIRSLRGNCDHRFYDEGLIDACSELIGLKPVNVELTRHGQWIKAPYSEKCGDSYCSECNHFDWSDCKYCSDCGCKMDGGNK